MRRRKQDQVGAVLAHIVSLPLWGGTCPVRLLPGWMWLRRWLADYRDQACRPAAAGRRVPPYVGLARARFGLGVAASGVTASRKKVLEGRGLSHRRGGTRLYLMDSMSRVASHELGGWETPGFLEGVYDKTLSEEVAPEMRSAIRRIPC